jgi:CRISPR-associated protein Csb1
MTEHPDRPLSFENLQQAVAGAAAIRLVQRFQPAGGPGDKVFPPTYAGGRYALETRRVNGSTVPCVLLDSVQSQANRLEEALLRAYDDDLIKFPLLAVDFSNDFPDIGRVTTLDASHRIADAIFRDSVAGALSFRESELGKAFEKSSVRCATALFEICPTALIFGVWDSTGSEGGLGNKFARLLTSEVVGFNVIAGVKPASRIDILQISSAVDIYESTEGGWTAEAQEARHDEDGNPIKNKKGKPSDINYSNVTPDIEHAKEPVRDDKGNVIVERGAVVRGGVTIDYAEQFSVLSMSGLRRLRFPDSKGKSHPERDAAAQAVLGALALAALVLQSNRGCDLRSRCVLVQETSIPRFGVITSGTDIGYFTLEGAGAVALLNEAVSVAKKQGLRWPVEPITLRPKPVLIDLIRKSRTSAPVEND